MADHINIQAPGRRSDLDDRIRAAKIEVELKVLQSAYDDMASSLDSIFTRIARGEPVELHYPDGSIVPITKARKRGGGEGDDRG